MRKLILLRHAESLWNTKNIFTGWTDVPLTENGVKQCIATRNMLIRNKLIPQVSFTSIQKRSVDTQRIIFSKWIPGLPTFQDWRLSEKHYGKLTGYNKQWIETSYGKIKSDFWRKDYFGFPPPLPEKKLQFPITRFADYNPHFGESFYMVDLRIQPFWHSIIKYIMQNQTPIICAHKNSLKMLIKNIENVHYTEIDSIHIKNCQPIVYTFDDNLSIIDKQIVT